MQNATAGQDGEINETIYIRVEDFVLELPVRISFTINESEVKTPYLEEDEVLYYCSELNGVVCLGGEVCDGEEKESIDGACCVGKCAEEKKKSRAWISWVIVVVLLIVVLFIFWKYRKSKGISGKEGFAKRVKEAEEKMP